MRMKLSRNYNCNTHADASHLRDTGNVLNEEKPQQEKADVALLAKVTSRKDSISSEEDDVLLEQFWSDANAPSTRAEDLDEQASSVNAQHEKEKILKSFKCDLIMLMDRIPGRLDITTQHLYFFSDQQEKKDAQACKQLKMVDELLTTIVLKARHLSGSAFSKSYLDLGMVTSGAHELPKGSICRRYLNFHLYKVMWV